MNRVFISDLHLETEHDAKYRAFQRVLWHVASTNQELYILGDLVEVWVGDDDDSSFATTLVDDLSECAASTDVFVMHGNRDFLYRDGFESRTGATLLPDPFLLNNEPDTEPVLLAHGDAYCTSDEAYMKVRELFRSETWQDQILGTSLLERRELAQALRAQSQQANQLKPANITDVVEVDVVDAMRRQGCRTMIHGHTHRPAIHHMINNTRRFVLGDWNECGWLLRQQDASFTLERFAI